MNPKGLSPIQRRFSAAAATYDHFADVQDRVAVRLLELALSEMSPSRPAQILEVGCGSGRLTRRLRETFPASRLWALDLSAAMVCEARKRVAAPPGTMGWAVGDAAQLPVRATFDALFSSSVLHWVDSLPAALGEIRRALNPGGLAALAIMTQGTLAELHAVRRRITPENLPLADLPASDLLREAVRASGLTHRIETSGEIVVTYPSAHSFLKTLHAQGLTGGRFSTSGRPLSRTQLRALIDVYDREFSVPGGVRATYRILWLIAENPVNSPSISGCRNPKTEGLH